MSDHALYRWCFTISVSRASCESTILKILTTHAKKFCFQKEKGEETGYLHWQGRFSLKRKLRRSQVAALFPDLMPHLSGEHSESGSFDYVLKDDTRIDGPWSDKDICTYIPTHLRVDEWNEFQRSVIERIGLLTPRQIMFVVDEEGCKGKSTLALRLACQRKADVLPPMLTSANDMLHWAFAKLQTRRRRLPVFIDLPRAYDNSAWAKFVSAIETIANGYAYDERYQFKDCFFESPQIVVFCNSIPDSLKFYLSSDRIVIYYY